MCASHSNIGHEVLFEDGLHLNDDGKVILANNFICFKYVYFMTQKKICNGTSKNDSLLNANFYSDNDESSIISNSSEVKESYPVFAMM